MKTHAFVILLLVLLLAIQSVFAVLENQNLKIYAITDDGQGLSADLTLEVEPGSGKIWSSVTPLVGTSTQNAERTAVELAKNYSSKVPQYDYKFQISSSASIVDGPSAGAATAFLVISSLTDKPIPKNVGLTGTIHSDGSVGPVGGIFEKAREANRIGIKLFMIPKGEAKQVVKLDNGVQSINLVEYAPREWGMKVIEVSTIDQVMQFAFSDIAAIDVNQQIEQTLTDFSPASITYASQAQPLAEITQKYVNESKRIVSEAKNALNTSTLADRSLIDIMLDSMNESERVLERASDLFDQNFLYSSANYSFLAKVNALMIKDIAQNPSLLSDSSVIFHSKLVAIQKEISQLKPRIDSGLVSENIDWQISAQQRLAWAENNVEKLLNTQTIVINDVSGTVEPDYSSQLDRLRDYEYAVGWKDVSNDLSQNLGKGRKLDPNNSEFNSYIDGTLVRAENRIAQLGTGDFEDITRRFESAKKEKENGWLLVAATDASAAAYLAEAELFSKDKDLVTLKAELENRIQSLDKNLSNAKQPFAWARIYLDHARYFKQGVDYYMDQNQTAAATSMAKSGVAIVYLAQSSFESSDRIYSYYEQLPQQLFDFQGQNTVTNPSNGSPLIPNAPINPFSDSLLLIAVIVVIMSWIIIAFLLHRHQKEKNAFASQTSAPINELNHIDSKIEKLDQNLSKGSITQNEYRYQKDQLLGERKKEEKIAIVQSRETVESDELKARVRALESELKLLRKDYSRGLILKTDYVDSVETTQKELKKTESQLKSKKKTPAKTDKKTAE